MKDSIEIVERVTARKAWPDEAEAIHRVLAAAFRGLRGRGYSHRALDAAVISPREISQRITQGDHVLVAEIGGQVVGTATGLEEHKALHVCSVAVQPAWQGRGIARTLMEALEDIAQLRGCHKLWFQTACTSGWATGRRATSRASSTVMTFWCLAKCWRERLSQHRRPPGCTARS